MVVINSRERRLLLLNWVLASLLCEIVPAQVCDLCGTDWLEDSVAETLELIVEQSRRKHPVVEVAYWQHETQALVHQLPLPGWV